MTRRKNILSVLSLASFIFIASCTQERQPCLTPTTAKLNIRTIQFKSGATNAVDTALPSAVFRAVTANDTPGFVFGRQATFAIQLSQVADSSLWFIKTDTSSTVYDTVVFRYSRNQHFISNACGFTYFFNLNTVNTTHQFIDSVKIINSDVTNNVNAGNIQIYIHPGS